jgi:hypothetical protein
MTPHEKAGHVVLGHALQGNPSRLSQILSDPMRFTLTTNQTHLCTDNCTTVKAARSRKELQTQRSARFARIQPGRDFVSNSVPGNLIASRKTAIFQYLYSRDKKQEERIESASPSKTLTRDFVATDLFGRGIDIERVNVVVNTIILTTVTSFAPHAGRFGTKGMPFR